MLSIRPYKAGDFSLMPPRPQETGIEHEEAVLDPLRCAHPSWTMCNDAGPIGSAGVIILRKGVAEAWLRGSLRFDGHKRAVARHVRLFLNEIIRDHDLHRVQMLVKAGNIKAETFAQWLGFTYEGTLEQMGEDRSDYLMMAKCEKREPHITELQNDDSQKV